MNRSYQTPRRLWRRGLLLAMVLLAGLGGWASLNVVTQAQETVVISFTYFDETGHYLRGTFRDYWNEYGGLEMFGYPVTEEFVRNSDGRIVQYFERARFELRVENGVGFVDLGNIGTELLTLRGITYPPVPPIRDTPTSRYFPETGHTLQGAFKAFWDTKDGATFFGAPLSEPFLEIFPDGVQRAVQYFERGRLEQYDNTIVVGRLGELLAPCHLTDPLPPDITPGPPRPEGAPDPDNPCFQPNIIATGYVYPNSSRPGTILGFDARGFRPNEVVSLWYNMPGERVRALPYTATADANGSVLIGLTTLIDDPVGNWELVAQGVQSKRKAVAPFVLAR
ncbi:MAG: hypothetical protein HC837_05330 [Chloroflexaceae bacterium]|nr:hypothetical protein [Chloroflexaceae bacterium]